MRGELLAARVDARDLGLGLDLVAGELGWERAFTRFSEARTAVLQAMQQAGADAELIRLMRCIKAGDVPEVADRRAHTAVLQEMQQAGAGARVIQLLRRIKVGDVPTDDD